MGKNINECKDAYAGTILLDNQLQPKYKFWKNTFWIPFYKNLYKSWQNFKTINLSRNSMISSGCLVWDALVFPGDIFIYSIKTKKGESLGTLIKLIEEVTNIAKLKGCKKLVGVSKFTSPKLAEWGGCKVEDYFVEEYRMGYKFTKEI